MSDKLGDAVGQRPKRLTPLSIMLTILFGPVILARPPDFSGWPAMTLLFALLGTVVWGAALYALAGVLGVVP